MTSYHKVLYFFVFIVAFFFAVTQIIPFLQGKQCLQRKINRYGNESLLFCARWA